MARSCHTCAYVAALEGGHMCEHPVVQFIMRLDSDRKYLKEAAMDGGCALFSDVKRRDPLYTREAWAQVWNDDEAHLSGASVQVNIH